MPSNTTASSSSYSSAGQGIEGGYEGDSLTLKVLIAFFLGLALYNVVELQVLIFGTFAKFKGLYFWSLVISGWGIIPYSVGFLFKYFSILTGGARWFSVFLLSIGWYPMVTGQAIVLWSRLHLIVGGEKGEKILRYTKWMIIVNAIVLHIPTTVLTIGSNTDSHPQAYVSGYNVMEKVQMCGFFLQEVILSSIYIAETIRILRTSVQDSTKRLMYQLMAINILIIAMDLGLLGLECASLYILETITKPTFYSIKLKLEFAILGKLVHFVGGRKSSLPLTRDLKRHPSALNGESDISDFVDLTKINTDVTRTSQPKRSSTRSRADARDLDLDLEIARLEHVETLPSQTGMRNGDIAPTRQRKLETLEQNYKDG
ncbi:integral membrane protein [Cladophialophora carrionii]|uniref:Integral membrane protein n=1 Tax=Cladophialophora carrionii TaxID=86049 RepID=A0A1C1D174_9EURO|nr:integral membrane protein [Cladophialophora carrionii]